MKGVIVILIFKYEKEGTEQEKSILEMIEKLIYVNREIRLYDLMNALGIYTQTKSMGKYIAGSGNNHIWISRNNRSYDRIAMIIETQKDIYTDLYKEDSDE